MSAPICVPNGPCLIPVAPDLMAPSGVLMIGIALVLRDLVQRRLGVAYSAGAIIVGALLSAAVAPAVAGACLGVRRSCSRSSPISRSTRRSPAAGWSLAVVASSAVGLVVDSIVFLWLAFGSLDFLLGQIVGKALDGAARHPVRRLSAPPRRAARPEAGLTGHRQ